jgi:hypothetical protein
MGLQAWFILNPALDIHFGIPLLPAREAVLPFLGWFDFINL